MVSLPLRPPPRRPAVAGRLVTLLCLLLVALALSAGPASAYSCGAVGSARTLAGHVTGPNDKDCAPARPAARKADPISFAFFVGIVIAVLLVPVALGRSRLEPEWMDRFQEKQEDRPSE